KVVTDPDALSHENFPFAAIKTIEIAGKKVTAFRISYVGEQGWELHMAYDDGLAVWDAFRDLDVTPVGVETYANTRRVEKSLRLQNADLLTEYNLLEADLARPKVKDADFIGKEAYLAHRAKDQQTATLCTLVMTDNVDGGGVARYPVGTFPIVDPDTGDVIEDAEGRLSYTTSMAFGPTIGKNIALGYLPPEHAVKGKALQIEYFNESYPVEVAGVGYEPLYDPENLKPRS
ncbi:MAG: aminomethyl transferase family protein, partial [Rhodospirillales bacterium]|nr:aminomethyl transferase family protein [Rhodospirillales bacterium]